MAPGIDRRALARRPACPLAIISLRQLAENAGLEGSVVVNDVRKAKKGFGLNASTNEVVDLVAVGVIDPAMVTRSAPEKGRRGGRWRHAGHVGDDVAL